MIPDIILHGLTYKADISSYTQELTNNVIVAFRGHDRVLKSLGVKQVSYGTDESELHPRTGYVMHVSTFGKSEETKTQIIDTLREVAANLSRGSTQYEVIAGRSNNRGSYASIRPALLTTLNAA